MMRLAVSIAAVAAVASADDAFSMEFNHLIAPYTNAEKHQVRVTNQMRRNNSVIRKAEWHTLLRTGDVFNGVTYGAFKSVTGLPVYKLVVCATCLTGLVTNLTAGPVDVSNNDPTGASGMDFTSLIPETVGSLNYRGISHMESGFGQFMTFKTTFNPNTCRFGRPTEVEVMDVSAIGGTWINCAGSISPWGTHLGSEEYEPNAKYYLPTSTLTEAKNARSSGFSSAIGFARYYNKYPEDILTMEDLRSVFKPYNFGFVPELNAIASPKTAVKHYAMGRKAYELAYVMPDGKTAYSTDDGDYGLLTKFVATRATDLSEGTLYCSKMKQTSVEPIGGGSFTIEWIQMSTSATDAQIKAIIDSGILFTDMFETAVLDLIAFPLTNGKGCDNSKGFFVVDTTGEFECLKVKPDMELAVSRLETRRYAHMLGCTTEWTKMEGFTHDADANVAYMAISRVESGMINTYANVDRTINNHISLVANPCGCVYRLPLTSTYDATSVTAIICGKPLGTSFVNVYNPSDFNRCDVNGIASPDNLHFDNKYKYLYIGEDSSGTAHQSDFMWHWSPKNGELTRILSSPYGSEVTSTWTHHIGDCSLVQAVVQHPYGESDQGLVSDPLSKGNQAYLGFITTSTPTPTSKKPTMAPKTKKPMAPKTKW